MLEVGCGTGVVAARPRGAGRAAAARSSASIRSRTLLAAARALCRGRGAGRARIALRVADGAQPAVRGRPLRRRAGHHRDPARGRSARGRARDGAGDPAGRARRAARSGLRHGRGDASGPRADRSDHATASPQRIYAEPYSGRRLPGLLRAAGLEDVRLLTDVYQDTTLEPWTKTFLERRAENAVRFGIVDAPTAAALARRLHRRRRRRRVRAHDELLRRRRGEARDDAAVARSVAARARLARRRSWRWRPGDASAQPKFDGAAALRHVERLVAIGPRVAGTPGGARAREYIVERAAQDRRRPGRRCEPFDADDAARSAAHGQRDRRRCPAAGPTSSCRPATTTRSCSASSAFVGANDGGSSAGAPARAGAAPRAPRPRELHVLARVVRRRGGARSVDRRPTASTAPGASPASWPGRAACRAPMILVDMIGDRDLAIRREAALDAVADRHHLGERRPARARPPLPARRACRSRTTTCRSCGSGCRRRC